MDEYILAIESSCDETSMSIIKNGHIEIETVTLSQMDIHAMYGGVVPEIASRNHIENITLVLEELLNKSNMKIEEMSAIGVTYGPGLSGSLLVGITFAKTLSYLYNKPLIKVHHIAGHIYANRLFGEFKFPLLALVVSGGHTDIIKMREDYNFEYLGGTVDDAIGEAYDKIARIINLAYPGGPRIDKLAYQGKHSYNLPTPMDDDTYNFSFSGLKSATINLVHNYNQKGIEICKEDLACSFQEVAINIIVKKTIKALKESNLKQLIVAGGVSANSYLRKRLQEECNKIGVELLVPDIKYCTDNAAMIGCTAYYAKKKGLIADLKLNAVSQEKLK